MHNGTEMLNGLAILESHFNLTGYSGAEERLIKLVIVVKFGIKNRTRKKSLKFCDDMDTWADALFSFYLQQGITAP